MLSLGVAMQIPIGWESPLFFWLMVWDLSGQPSATFCSQVWDSKTWPLSANHGFVFHSWHPFDKLALASSVSQPVS